MPVYFAQRRPGGPIKIGSSWNPQLRARHFGLGTKILAQIEDGPLLVEELFHGWFAGSRIGSHSLSGLSGGTEWFEPTADLLAVIDAINAGRLRTREDLASVTAAALAEEFHKTANGAA